LPKENRGKRKFGVQGNSTGSDKKNMKNGKTDYTAFNKIVQAWNNI
jgi:hypothetical protein